MAYSTDESDYSGQRTSSRSSCEHLTERCVDRVFGHRHIPDKDICRETANGAHLLVARLSGWRDINAEAANERAEV